MDFTMSEYHRVRLLDTVRSVATSWLLASIACAFLSLPVLGFLYLTQERTTEMRLEMCDERVRQLQHEAVDQEAGLAECWEDLRRLSRQSKSPLEK